MSKRPFLYVCFIIVLLVASCNANQPKPISTQSEPTTLVKPTHTPGEFTSTVVKTPATLNVKAAPSGLQDCSGNGIARCDMGAYEAPSVLGSYPWFKIDFRKVFTQFLDS